MKVAVLGAGNFVAARIIESFHLGDGPSVVAIGRRPGRLCVAARFAVDLRVADLADTSALASAFAGCRAAIAPVRLGADESKHLMSSLCRAAAQARVKRIVLISCLPASLNESGTDNPSPKRPAGPEQQFLSECRRTGVEGIVLTAGFIYGPRSPLIAAIATDLHTGCAWLPTADPGAMDALYVDNLVAAAREALRAKPAEPAVYHIADQGSVTWRRFYEAVAQVLDLSTSAIRPAAMAALLPNSTFGTADLVRLAMRQSALPARPPSLSSYSPIVPFADAIRRSCAWWRFAHGLFDPV